MSDALPSWLTTFDAFSAHLLEQISDESSHGRGLRFVDFALRLLPQLPEAAEFSEFRRNEKLSHDQGVDILTGVNEDGRQLFIQSRLTLQRTKDLDSVLSQFQDFESEKVGLQDIQGSLFTRDYLGVPSAGQPQYLIVSSSKCRSIVNKYKTTHLASRSFYDRLVEQGRIQVVDGTDILRTLQSIYRKSFQIPSQLTLKPFTNWLKVGNVRLGVVSGSELVRLYDEHGDGLFFENIRSFLGLERNQDRESVNHRIVKTVQELPHEMLGRNNGITIRASRVQVRADDTLELANASIVNGCQTTMCIVTQRERLSSDVRVPIKVVESSELWEVAHSANYQNRVRQVDLDLAKYLRPQLVQKAAANMGVSLESQELRGVSQLVTTISDTNIIYEEAKALYRGIFSERPNNVFENNYNKLLISVLDNLYSSDTEASEIFQTLFTVSAAAHAARERGESIYQGSEYQYFQRFNKPQYTAYISLLAASAVTRINLALCQQAAEDKAVELRDWLAAIAAALGSRADEFEETYLTAYEVLSEAGMDAITEVAGDELVSRDLHKKIVNTPFTTFYNAVCMRTDRQKARERTSAIEP